jgi:predicted NAD-dependent protein-ADP-ribosyltransferase YbiA (DUF1768 family)
MRILRKSCWTLAIWKLLKKIHMVANDIHLFNIVADPYWGNGPDGSGKNMLGKILMEVREEIKKQV